MCWWCGRWVCYAAHKRRRCLKEAACLQETRLPMTYRAKRACAFVSCATRFSRETRDRRDSEQTKDERSKDKKARLLCASDVSCIRILPPSLVTIVNVHPPNPSIISSVRQSDFDHTHSIRVFFFPCLLCSILHEQDPSSSPSTTIPQAHTLRHTSAGYHK